MPTKLADGQEWHLRRPVVSFDYAENESGMRIGVSLDDGDDLQELMDQRAALFDSGKGKAPVAELAPLELKIGARLLIPNYDLKPNELGRLLRFGYDENENPEASAVRDAVMAVAEGTRGPKASDGGEGSPPTPSDGSPG